MAKLSVGIATRRRESPGRRRGASSRRRTRQPGPVGRPSGHDSQAVRDGVAQAPARARDHAGVRQGEGPEDRGDLRGARRGRQGRGDQTHRRADESPCVPCRRAPRADRAREIAMVLPALRAAPSRRRGDRPVRSLVVQPRRRRARDGVLHRARVRGVHALLPGVRANAAALGDPGDQVLVLGLRRGKSAASRRACTIRCAAGS